MAIKRCGGIAIVQDPTDARYPDMPTNALEQIEINYCVPILKMGAILYRLTQEPVVETPSIPEDLRIEVSITENPTANSDRIEELGESASMICPDCGGPLRELRDEKLRRYRCRLGHAFTAESLLEGQSEAIEYALWAAVRTMEDRARILMNLANGRREQNHSKLAATYEAQADELKRHAEQIRKMLLAAGNS
jgi:two-component system chemotaxis response regulator CheB